MTPSSKARVIGLTLIVLSTIARSVKQKLALASLEHIITTSVNTSTAKRAIGLSLLLSLFLFVQAEGLIAAGPPQIANERWVTEPCRDAGFNACRDSGCSCQTTGGMTTCQTVPFMPDPNNIMAGANACLANLTLTNKCNTWSTHEWVDSNDNRHRKCECTEKILCDTTSPPPPNNDVCLKMKNPAAISRYMCVLPGQEKFCCKGRMMVGTGLPKCIDVRDGNVTVMGVNMTGYEACQFVQQKQANEVPDTTTLAQCNSDCKDCSDWPGYPPPATTLPNNTMTCADIDNLENAMKAACEQKPDCLPCTRRVTGKYWKCDNGAGSREEGYFICSLLMACPAAYQPSACQQPSPPAYCSDVPIGNAAGAPPNPPGANVVAAHARVLEDTNADGVVTTYEMFKSVLSMVRAMATQNFFFDLTADGKVTRADLAALVSLIRADIQIATR